MMPMNLKDCIRGTSSEGSGPRVSAGVAQHCGRRSPKQTGQGVGGAQEPYCNQGTFFWVTIYYKGTLNPKKGVNGHHGATKRT